MKTFILLRKYKEQFSIPYLDLADAAETNRIHLLISSPFIFAFGLINLIVNCILHRSNLKEHIPILTYFGIFTLLSLYIFIHSKKVKNIAREKAYIAKTIPFYMLFHIAQSAAIYNFYILGQPFNGFLIFELTGFISLGLFSFSPIPFLFSLTAGMIIMGPGLYWNFGLSGLADSIVSVLFMFYLSLYRKKIEKRHIMLLKKQKNVLVAKTFGNFTLLYDDKVVKFCRTKSNELMGYLIYKKGSSVNTKELISVLWGDHADSSRYGNNLRNLIVDIKHTMKELEIQSFFIAEYNNFRINPELVKCDYYDFLAGDETAKNSFAGEFMSQFSWAEEVSGFLEMKALK